jgi:hypothetical protein
MSRPAGVLLALVVSLVAPGAIRAEMPSVAIGLIAPMVGRSAGAGAAHKSSTEWALAELHYTLEGPTGPVLIRLIPRDDGSDPELAAREASELVHDDGVVAILGPVNSASTMAVLAVPGLDVPVVSPLSTAPELTAPRSRWFFRATINDRDRMRRYADYIDDRLGARGAAVLLYEDDAYGRGLAEALRDHLSPAPVMAATWTELGADGTPAGWRRLAEGAGFADAVLARLPEGPLDVFVLGTSEGADAIGRGLDRRLRAGRGAGLRFFFVGGVQLFLAGAPDGSITIGEPTVDAVADEFVADPSTLRVLRDERQTFLVTSFEAARFVVPAAIERVLADGGSLDDPARFRDSLRQVLGSHAFDSLVPWRKIRFVDGALQDPPATPIFKLARAAQRLDRMEPPPWFVFHVPRETRFLEEPMRATIERFPVGDEDIEVQVLNERGDRVASEQVRLTGGKGTLVYHPLHTGRYRLWSSAVHVPSQPHFEVGWTWDYPLAVLGAIAGCLLGAGRPSSLRWPLRLLVAVGTGAALFVISSWGRDTALAGIVPLPSFHAVPSINAFLVGLVGGWGGHELLLRILRVFTGDASAKRSVPAH